MLRSPKVRPVAALVGLIIAGSAVAAGAGPSRPEQGRPRRTEAIVIAHRGASGYRPEHTLAAYELAIRMGADYIEPDLVSTADGILVARHENEISTTTDVEAHTEFADRRTTKTIDGIAVTGWFTEDFTLEELRTLRATERLPEVRPDSTAFDGQYAIPTFDEVLELAQSYGVGVYPETKHPTYFDSIGLSLEEPLVAALDAHGLDSRRDAVFVQSFETANLRDLDTMTDVRLVQLLSNAGQPYDLTVAGDPRTYADLATRQGLRWIDGYADGIGANKDLIIPRDASGALLDPTTLVADAHRQHLVVHVWTFRNENIFLPLDFRAGDPAHPEFPRAEGDAPSEHLLFLSLGIDGVFSDNPDTAVAARAAYLAGR